MKKKITKRRRNISKSVEKVQRDRRPTLMLIHPNVWPQYTNVTEIDRQTAQDRQRSDSKGRTLLQTVAQKIDRGKAVADVDVKND